MSAPFSPHYHWAILLWIAFFFWSYRWMKPRYGAAASLLLSYLAFSAISVWIWVENRYFTLNPYDQMALRYFAVDSLARLLLLLVPLMVFAERRFQFLFFGEVLARGFVWLNSLWILVEFLRAGCAEANQCGGVGNPSIMVGLTVTLLPLAIQSWKQQWPTLLLVGLAVFLSKSSVALGLLGLYLLYGFFRECPRRYWKYSFLAFLLPFVGGYFLVGGHELFSSSQRFLVWSFMMEKWSTWRNMPFGMGWGTYHVFSINLQNVPGLPKIADGSHWNSMHNDWLQMFFEGGMLAGLLSIVTYIDALKRLWERQEWPFLMSLILYGIYMGVNPALHHAIPAFFGAWLFLIALKRQTNIFKETRYA